MARVIHAPARVVPHAVATAREQADAIVRAAEAEARATLDAARAEAEAVRARAEAEGHAAGLARTAALLAHAMDARARAIDEAEGAVVALVRSIAERVLAAALSDAPERIVPAVRAHLEPLRRARRLRLRVHPDDASALAAALSEDALPVSAEVLQLEPDHAVQRGGCVVDSDLGTVDARLEVQLAAFERALREVG
jgi:flagellar biosynthesis/type III secretory pathway protein FliH